jgi:polysaccharide pyruvyl transferase WcaK-like protein
LRPERFVIYGEFGCGNMGNEASLAAVLAWLPPDIPVLSVTREPERVTAEHGIVSVSMHARRPAWLPGRLAKAVGKIVDQFRLLRLIRPSDYVIVPGTGVFEQAAGGPPWGLPLALAGLATAVRLRGARFALVGIGASPDSRRSVRMLNRWTIGAAHYITARDTYSQRGLASLGMSLPDDRVFPDVAFALVHGTGRGPAAQPGRSLRVGLGVMAYHDADDPEKGAAAAARYEVAVTQFARHVVSCGHHVDLLVGDRSDEAVARRVVDEVAGVPGSGSISFREFTGYDELISRIAGLDVVVGSRYHNLVFALISGVPAMSVGYAAKCDALLAEAGLGRYTIPLQEAGAEAMNGLFEQIVKDLPEAAAVVAAFRRRGAVRSRIHRDDFLADMSPMPQPTLENV